MPKPFSTIPFFRILLPYCVGLLYALYIATATSYLILCLALLAVLSAAFLKAKKSHYLQIAAADVFLFCLASLQINYSYKLPAHSSIVQRQYLVRLCDIPLEKSKSIKFEAEILAVQGSDSLQLKHQHIFLYFRKSKSANELRPGQVLQLSAKLQTPAGRMNPHEFNYRNYLLHKHVLYTAFIDSTAYTCDTMFKPKQSLWYRAIAAKEKVLHTLKTAGLTQHAYSICAALLSGYDDEVEKDIVNAFAKSGTLHVLSVSGLHTGLLYAVIAWLFGKVDRYRKYRITEFIITAILLWSFAYFTGLAPPVVRAVLMFSFLGIGRLFFRSSARNQLNILALSAFLMLLYDPLLILDLGFLLSYGAMFGLIFYTPSFSNLYLQAKAWQKLLLNSFSASVAATIPTLPLSLLVFKQFPLWFVFANLIVVPASFFLLLAAFLIVTGLNFLVPVVNLVTNFLVKFILLFAEYKGMVIDGIDFVSTDALFMCLLILFATMAITQHHGKALLATAAVLVAWQSVALLQSVNTKSLQEITVYSIRKQAAMSVKAKQVLYYQADSAVPYAYSIQPHLRSFNYAKQKDTLFNYVAFKQCAALIIDSNDTYKNVPAAPFQILIVKPGARLNQHFLKNSKHLQLVVLQGTRSPKQMSFISNLCRNFKIKLYATAQQGACVLSVNSTGYEIENWR